MVARIRTGKSVKGAINYNERKVKEGKARLLMAVGYSKEIPMMNFFDKWKRLQHLADLNTRTATNCLHISLNFDPSEKLNADKLKAIAQDYMQGLGFEGQPLLIYQHLDAAHPHLHIVTTNIQRTGQRISLHNLGKLSSEPTRKMLEDKFGLVKATGKQASISKEQIITGVIAGNYGKSATKKSITNIVTSVLEQYQFASLAEFNAVLKQFNVTATRGKEGTRMFEKRGLQYSLLDKNGKMVGVPIKASSITGGPTLAKLEFKFQQGREHKPKLKGAVRERVADCLGKSASLQAFTENLKEYKIDIVLRKNEDGFVYGITYVDQQTRAVFNGSELGKQFSAEAIRSLTGSPTTEATLIVPTKPVLMIEKTFSTGKRDDNLHSHENMIEVISDKGPYDYLPYELSIRKKRKRQKGKK